MTAIDDFISEARMVDIETAFAVAKGDLKAMRRQGSELVGPCPACGGRDRFNLNLRDGVWHCRQCDGGKGGDGLALIAQVHGFNLKSRAGLLAACAEILGRAAPDGSEEESEQEKAERLQKLEVRRKKAERDRAESQATADRKRQFAISQGRGFWTQALPGWMTVIEDYLRLRTAARHLSDSVWENLRFKPEHSYFDGKDDRGYDREIHCGPAMIAPLIMPLTGDLTGCHQTWIDLSHEPKFRPDLGLDAKGEPRVTKKMRGHHKGTIIPIAGNPAAERWLMGEGIETTISVADKDSWRADTFYCAGGSIGNIAGPADPKSRFRHPTLTTTDARGVTKPVMVAGPVPKPGSEEDCYQLPAHVRELIHLADGDSELWWTLSCMARAEARLAREDLVIATWWPPDKTDFAALAVAAEAMERQLREAA